MNYNRPYEAGSTTGPAVGPGPCRAEVDALVAPVETVAPDADLSEASRRLYEANIGSLVVGDDPLTGIVTTTDLALHLPDYRVNMAHQSEPDITDGEWE